MDDLVFKAGQCWKDGVGTIHRLREKVDEYAFESWADDRWWLTYSPGRRPFVPCEDPSKPEWRDGMAAMHWALDHPGRELEGETGCLFRFYAGSFEKRYSGGWVLCEKWFSKKRPVSGTW